MKKFFDVYIRAAGAELDFTKIDESPWLNILSWFDRLELLDAKPEASIEADTRELADGTTLAVGETMSFKCATLRGTEAEFDYLRATYHNELCDVLMYDPNAAGFVAVLYRVRAQVTALAEGGEPVLFTVSGTRRWGAEAEERTIDLAAANVDEPVGMISGTIYATDGETPVEGVMVQTDISGSLKQIDVSDVNGHYLIALPAGTYDINASLLSYTWTEVTGVVVTRDEELKLDFTATAEP